jgi:hypothetical protein
MTGVASFQRVILGVRHHAPREGLRQAVDIANFLEAELRGLCVNDEQLSGLAGRQFVREFRPLEGGWRNIDNAELSDAFDVTARSAERLFRDAVKRFSQSCEFEIIRGYSFAKTIASISRPGDVLVISQPASPVECITLQFRAMVKAAFESPASVMLVPAGIVRERGDVVALTGAHDDPCIEVAERIASRAQERLLVIDGVKIATEIRAADQNESGDGMPSATPVQPRVSTAITEALNPLRERLLILSRNNFGYAVAEFISATRRVPVLAIEPRTKQE